SVGYANGIRVMSMTHTGEPGFIIYIPIEYLAYLYNDMRQKGTHYALAHLGHFSVNTNRYEFLSWTTYKLNILFFPSTYPLEKNQDDTDFIGRESHLPGAETAVTRRFTMFILEDHNTDLDLWPWWGEPIFRNGRYIGTTTSSAYSYTLQQHVCLGFVQHFDLETGERLVVTPDFINRGEYEIEISGQRFRAKAKLYPFSNLFVQKWQKDATELGDVQSK
uniref:Aminomethyltransferase C-terminal domain-containing protein n=1 Tax=Latimeria chalumnae TaxID=7897 RepID=H2ZWH9_LATCH